MYAFMIIAGVCTTAGISFRHQRKGTRRTKDGKKDCKCNDRVQNTAWPYTVRITVSFTTKHSSWRDRTGGRSDNRQDPRNTSGSYARVLLVSFRTQVDKPYSLYPKRGLTCWFIVTYTLRCRPIWGSSICRSFLIPRCTQKGSFQSNLSRHRDYLDLLTAW